MQFVSETVVPVPVVPGAFGALAGTFLAHALRCTIHSSVYTDADSRTGWLMKDSTLHMVLALCAVPSSGCWKMLWQSACWEAIFKRETRLSWTWMLRATSLS